MSEEVCAALCADEPSRPKHHDLLAALLKSPDDIKSPDGASRNCPSLKKLEDAIESCLKQGWDRNDDVSGPDMSFPLPLVHWASILGKCTALEWMLNNGFSALVCSSYSQDTALHNCVKFLSRSDMASNKVTRLVELLKDCLMIKNEGCDTPLHLAAKQLVHVGRRYGPVLEIMMSQARELDAKAAVILDSTNKDGNTIAHILAQKDECISAMKKIIRAGPDLTIKNLEGLTALQVAVNSGSTSIAKEMEQRMPQILCNDTGTVTKSPQGSQVQNDNQINGKHDRASAEEQSNCTNCQDETIHRVEGVAVKCKEDIHIENHGNLMSLAQIKKETFFQDSESQTEVNKSIQPSCCNSSTCNEDNHNEENPGLNKSKKATCCDNSTQCNEDYQVEENSGSNKNKRTTCCDNSTQCNEDYQVEENSGSNENKRTTCCDNSTQCNEDYQLEVKPGERRKAVSCDNSTQCDEDYQLKENLGLNESKKPTCCENSTQCNEGYQVEVKSGESKKAISCDNSTQCDGKYDETYKSTCCSRATEAESTNSSTSLTDLGSTMIMFLEGADLLQGVTKLTNDARLKNENILKEKLKSIEATNSSIKEVDDEIDEKKRELERVKADLERLSVEKNTVQGKRKRANEECMNLKKKVQCCDSLLRSCLDP